jgi:hypothetical protein
MDRPFDYQDLENLELFKKGVENAVGHGGGDEGYRNIFYKEGYEFGMFLWSQYIDAERSRQDAENEYLIQENARLRRELNELKAKMERSKQ